MKVAYHSPLPPERSGIADYSALLLPELRRHVEVEVARGGRRRAPRGTDVALYHVGNDPEAHGWILEALRRRPGVVVLHEYVLHHLVAGMTLARRDVAQYLAAMEREAGLPGRLLALGVVDGCIPPLWETRPEDFALAGIVLDAATGLIVHSRYVEERAREAGYEGPVWRIPHPAWPRPDVGAGAPVEGDPVIACLGHLNPSKRVPQLLEAFARVREARPQARLVLAGAVAPRLDLDARLRRLGLDGDPSVVREGYVDEARLWQLLDACDVCVSLRSPTMGETSGIALRALSLGRPLVVSDVGWFAELPDEAALKVRPGEREVEELAAALDRLAASPEERARMGEAARAHAEREHALPRVAELYAAALEEAAGGRAVADAVLAEVAGAAAEVGIEPGSAEAAELGARVREARIGD
ncbi:MAG TPA: glycosyltransferase family 4 protein [Gaiellaceae bacterium]|nr:glycosyltransferase family 4 protein [Gaiellaceae bacterium]